MEQHVKILGILDIIMGSLGALGGFFFMAMFLFFAPVMGASGQEGAAAGAAIFATVGLTGGFFFIGFGVFQIVVGIKLQKHKPWARIAQIVLGFMTVLGFPIGTAFGGYSIWAMLNQDTAALFEKTT